MHEESLHMLDYISEKISKQKYLKKYNMNKINIVLSVFKLPTKNISCKDNQPIFSKVGLYVENTKKH